MFDRFTYKQKNYGLLALFVLMIMVSYKRSFVLSLNALTQIESQEQQKQNLLGAENDIAVMRIQLAQMNKTIGRSDLAPDKVNQEILRAISDYTKNLYIKLDKIRETHAYKTVDFTIYSNMVSVEGDLSGILQLAYYMENKFEFARLTNISLYKEMDYSTKKEKLYANLLFQHYRQN